MVFPTFVTLFYLLAVSLLYALFDVFNKRDVPNAFVYAALVLAFLFTLTYPLQTIYISVAIALAVGTGGYLLYRKGLLGAGDFFEFVTISLILPLQPAPLLAAVNQFNLPFILSVFVATGYVTVILIAIYYLLIARNKGLEKGVKPDKNSIRLGLAMLLTAYAILLFVVSALVNINVYTIILIILIAIPSYLLLAYQKLINIRMVSFMYPKGLNEGDMIAVSLMSKAQRSLFKRKSKLFGGLATRSLIADIKEVKVKIPVYRNAAPLALFIFIGVVLSLLFGNILLFMFQ